jgi:dCMP deaminase
MAELDKIIQKIKPRDDNRFSWDELFMSVALVYAQRSPDPSTQVGACIVDKNNIVIATGYNGLPRGCKNEDYPWEREGDFLDRKYAYVIHAEANALINCKHRNDLYGGKLYVTLFPCNECAKPIITSGINEIVYLSDKYKNEPYTIAAKRMLDSATIKYRQFTSSRIITLEELLGIVF